MPAKSPYPPGRFGSLGDIARIAGRNKATVQYWIKSGKLVVPDDGMTPEEIGAFLAEKIRPVGAERKPTPGADPHDPEDAANPDYHRAKARREFHNAELARLKVEQLKGNLIEASEVERKWSANIAALSDAVEKQIAKIAPKLPKLSPAEILKELRGMWREARERATIQEASE